MSDTFSPPQTIPTAQLVSLNIQQNVVLAPYTTFQCGGAADYFAQADTFEVLEKLCNVAHEHNLSVTVLGGGSNILISDAGIRGLVIRVVMNSKKLEPFEGGAYLLLGAGENWDAVTAFAVEQGLYGIETLALIPGTVGGAIVQNIGAYGSEIVQVLESIDLYDPLTQKRETITADQAGFAYRMSIFKKERRHCIVLGCTLRLSSTPPAERVLYPDVEKYVREKNAGELPQQPTAAELREAVVAIRTAKLPDWHVLGTAGSYFKNPIIDVEHYEKLKQTYPDLPSFALKNDPKHVKVPLAWIVDKICGLKGYRQGPVGIYEKQAIVLVNYGGAKAGDVRNVEHFVMESVKNKTDITIEREVEIIGFI